MEVKEAIDAYLKKGFGTMNKTDFEVWIFHKWITDPQNVNKSNYEISRELRLSEAKVKKLRYEADLRYIDKVTFEAERQSQLEKLFNNAFFDYSSDRIMFSVEDVALRQYIDHCLKEENRFSNTSFNREIISLSIDNFEILLRKTDPDNSKMERLMEDARDKLKDEKITFKGLLKKFAEGFAEGAGSHASKGVLIGLSLGHLSELLDKLARTFNFNV